MQKLAQNLIEKIVQRYVLGNTKHNAVRAADFVNIRPKHILTHDNTAAVLDKFSKLSPKAHVFDPSQPVFALDHDIQNKTEKNLAKYAKIASFASSKQIDFYPAGRGIGHQVMIEEGYAFPGTFVVASDSHANIYGGIACLGTPVVRTDAAAIWMTGQTWWQVPPVAKVELVGRKLPPGVTGKDVILALCGAFNQDEVLNHAVEFSGEALKSLSIEDRLTIANMTTEWGALAGIFPGDEELVAWMKNRAEFLKRRGPSQVPSDRFAGSGYEHPRVNYRTIRELEEGLDDLNPDQNAKYAKHLLLDVESLIPYAAGPNSVKKFTSIAELHQNDIKVNKAYIVSCVNSRVQDLKAAADVLRGKVVHPDVELYVAAASSEVQATCEQEGYWDVLMKSGAKPLPPGCGPCIGMGAGLLKDGEVGISATNRNFKGRMGSPLSLAYLASPAVVAASAISGKITAPSLSSSNSSTGLRAENLSTKQSGDSQKQEPLLPDFPSKVEGSLVLLDNDNINTDGIYPGKYTYREDLTRDEMAAVAMENYDLNFSQIVKKGSILLSGYNFGTGSSREQAATCLKFKGVSLVIAGSFSATYMRNAINNGFLVLESPSLIDYVRSNSRLDNKPTQLLSENFEVNFERWVINFDGKEFPLIPMGAAAQEIIVSGGLEPLLLKSAA